MVSQCDLKLCVAELGGSQRNTTLSCGNKTPENWVSSAQVNASARQTACGLVTVRLVAVCRLHTDEDVLVQEVLWVGDDRGELEETEKNTNEDRFPKVIFQTESSVLNLPQLGCQTKLLLTQRSAPCCHPLKSWLFLQTFREILVLTTQPVFKLIPIEQYVT